MENLSARLEGMDDLLTVSEVAKLLRVDNTTVRRWVKKGALDAVMLPHATNRQGYRIVKTAVQKLFANLGV